MSLSWPQIGQRARALSTMDEIRREYYQSVGWDESGTPKLEELRRLGLEKIDARDIEGLPWRSALLSCARHKVILCFQESSAIRLLI